jgi:iron complex transport system substrate-binding protein
LQSIDDIKRGLIRLGDLYDQPGRARELVDQIDTDLLEAREAARRAFADPADPDAPPWRPRVLFVVGRNPGTLQQIYAAGTGSFVEVLIEAAGGTNVLETTAVPWPVVGKEAILAMDPDVIIDGSYMSESTREDDEQLLTPWQQLSVLRAVREGRVIALHDDHMLIPGPSVGEAASRLGKAMRRVFPERSWNAERLGATPGDSQAGSGIGEASS